MARKRGFMLVALLATGAAIGVAGALMARRRQQQQWEEFAAAGPLDSLDLSEDPGTAPTLLDEATQRAGDTDPGAVERAEDQVADAAQATTDKVTAGAETLREKTTGRSRGPANRAPREVAERTGDLADDFANRFGASSRNSRG